jgi:hypothetical protein
MKKKASTNRERKKLSKKNAGRARTKRTKTVAAKRSPRQRGPKSETRRRTKSLALSPFALTASDVKTLTAEQAVDALRDLLHVEAYAAGVPLSSVDVPAEINVRDGGVDAEFKIAVGTSATGILYGGRTRYQVKTGSFNASTPAQLKSILLKPASLSKRKPTPDDLNDRVKECLDSGGTLVVTLFGSDSVDRTAGATQRAFRTYLSKLDRQYRSAKVEIVRANQLAAQLSHIPGLSLRLKGIATVEPFAHDHMWMRDHSGFEGQSSFRASPEHVRAIQLLRDHVNNSDKTFSHIRCVGEPGSGKTRLIYEALSPGHISPLVVYCPDSAAVLNRGVLEHLAILASQCPMILVADECDGTTRDAFHTRLRTDSARLTLISIHHEESPGDNDPRFVLLGAPHLLDTQTAEILESYGIPANRSKELAALCEGSPRVAHGVGMSIASSPESTQFVNLQSLDNIWDVYLAGRKSPRDQQYETRLSVVRCLALFKKFGWKDEHRIEAQSIWRYVVQQLDSSISWPQFNNAVEHYRSRRVLQGRTTLYISPKLLHIKLWCDWWNLCSPGIADIPSMLNSLSEQLRDWLNEMFIYARESKAATTVVDTLLSADGPYATIEGLNSESESALFFTLAQVNPKAAVRTLYKALDGASIEIRSRFGDGRRYVVHALERVAIYEDCFLDAAKCLLLLAEAENEDWSNNATGVFTDLFTLGYGPLASSALPPRERLPFLISLIRSPSEKRRALALSAIDVAFRTRNVRTHIGDTQGLQPLPQRWKPQTYGEVWAAYSAYVESLYAELQRMEVGEAKKAAEIIAAHAEELLQIKTLTERVAHMLSELLQRKLLSPSQVLEKLVWIKRRMRDRADVQSSIEPLYSSLAEGSFAARLRRAVLVQDYSPDPKIRENIERSVRTLAEEAIASPELIDSELEWLLSPAAKNAYAFAHELGMLDVNLILWPRVVQNWRNGSMQSDLFIGGYLSGLFQRSPETWNLTLTAIAKDDALVHQFPTLLWRSGMSNEMAMLLMNLAKSQKVQPSSLRVFIYGDVLRRIPKGVVHEFLRMLLSSTEKNDAYAAIEIFAAIIRREEPANEEDISTCQEILNNPVLYRSDGDSYVDTMVDFHWNECAMYLLSQDETRALHVARTVVNNFGTKGTIFGAYRPQSLEFLDEVVRRHPRELWKAIADCITIPLDERSFDLMQWLRAEDRPGSPERQPTFEMLPVQDVLDWIRLDANRRAAVIAHFVPPAFDTGGLGPSMGRAVMEEFGNLKPVRQAFHANFQTDSWSGPASAHLTAKKTKLAELRATETNANVRRWLNEAIEALEKEIALELAREERE